MLPNGSVRTTTSDLGSTELLAHLMINLIKWHELPKRYQTIIAGAAAYVNSELTAR
jgi:TRAP-type mannitol/chloroaromatic compound transport system substrate-binding protein